MDTGVLRNSRLEEVPKLRPETLICNRISVGGNTLADHAQTQMTGSAPSSGAIDFDPMDLTDENFLRFIFTDLTTAEIRPLGHWRLRW